MLAAQRVGLRRHSLMVIRHKGSVLIRAGLISSTPQFPATTGSASWIFAFWHDFERNGPSL
jgi:hypothetical protein